MTRVRAYIDGFNLYFGLKAKFGRSYHWLDVQALVKSMLRPGQELDQVEFFTARIRNPTRSRHRQDTYLQALNARCDLLRIIEGRFQQKNCVCFACRARWVTYEEKETDVSLAVALVEDAALDRFDIALIISADSDLCPAIRARPSHPSRLQDCCNLPTRPALRRTGEDRRRRLLVGPRQVEQSPASRRGGHSERHQTEPTGVLELTTPTPMIRAFPKYL